MLRLTAGWLGAAACCALAAEDGPIPPPPLRKVSTISSGASRHGVGRRPRGRDPAGAGQGARPPGRTVGRRSVRAASRFPGRRRLLRPGRPGGAAAAAAGPGERETQGPLRPLRDAALPDLQRRGAVPLGQLRPVGRGPLRPPVPAVQHRSEGPQSGTASASWRCSPRGRSSRRTPGVSTSRTSARPGPISAARRSAAAGRISSISASPPTIRGRRNSRNSSPTRAPTRSSRCTAAPTPCRSGCTRAWPST